MKPTQPSNDTCEPSEIADSIPIIVCIDVEPDPRVPTVGGADDWAGFEATHLLFRELRVRLREMTGKTVHFNWFLRIDPQIEKLYGSATWVVGRYQNIFDELRSEGDELGLHIHAWRWREDQHRWIADFADQSWIGTCVSTGFEGFCDSLSYPCHAFRFGDRWTNNATFDLLERHGAHCDLSVEPGFHGIEIPEVHTGLLPSYLGAPRVPYRPSRANCLVADPEHGRNLWELPVSSGPIHCPPVSFDRRPSGSSWVVSYDGKTSTGTLSADPNPMAVDQMNDAGETTLTWTCRGAQTIELRVDAPDGPLLAQSAAASGSVRTGKWVIHDQVFYLQDVTDGRALTREHTLATLRMHLTSLSSPSGSDPHGEYMTLNLGQNSPVYCKILNSLLQSKASHPIVTVGRSDMGSSTRERNNFEQTIAYMLSHPHMPRMEFVTTATYLERECGDIPT